VDGAGRGETDLARLLQQLRPVLDPQRWVFCTLPGDAPPALGAEVVVREAEGWTVVVPAAAAVELAARGAVVSGAYRRVTLTVHSSLDAVGLLAAVARALADAGIACNVVAGFYHDHLFVPEARADDAVAVLERLARGAAHARD
jgi:hypothetical protein